MIDAQRSDEELLRIIQRWTKGAEQATSPSRIAEDGVLERFIEKDGLRGEIWGPVVPAGKAGGLMTWKEFCFRQVHTGILGAHRSGAKMLALLKREFAGGSQCKLTWRTWPASAWCVSEAVKDRKATVRRCEAKLAPMLGRSGGRF